MAGVNLSDDVALAATAISGLFRMVAANGPGRFAANLGETAAAAGLSIEQAHQFVRGELVLPPHQALVFVTAVLERERVWQVALAEYRTSQAPPPVTVEDVQRTIRDLTAEFPAWQIAADGQESIAADKTKLLWRATATEQVLFGTFGHSGGWADVTAPTAEELGGKLRSIEKHLTVQRDRMARYHDGRGIPGRIA